MSDVAVLERPAVQAAMRVGEVPILLYHSVDDAGPPELTEWRVTPATFRAHLQFLREHGFYSISLGMWAKCLASGIPLPGRPVIITFDDGYKNFLTNAYPLLEEFDFRATIFVTTEKVGGTADWDRTSWDPLPLMDWDDLRFLQMRGYDIASHTTAHLNLLTLSDAEIVLDSGMCRSVLREQLGRDVRSIAFPWGLHDDRVRETLASVGYDIGLSTQDGRSRLDDDPMCLPRIDVTHDTDMQTFADKLLSEAATPPSTHARTNPSRKLAQPLRPGVTAVVTSCGRQDLLEHTLISFFACNTHPIDKVIVVEDGPAERNAALQEKFSGHNIQWVATGRRLGQIIAIDYAYAHVETEMIFHMEDDWEFYAAGFIEKSVAVLRADPCCAQVWLRPTIERETGWFMAPQVRGGVTVRKFMTDSTRIWHGFSFNPGVRRTIDYRRLGTYSRHVRFDFDHPPASEIGLNNVVRDLGLYAYLLADNFGYGYVRHTGHERHVGKQPLDPKTQAELDEAHAQVAELTREVELLRQSQAAASSRSAALEQQLAQARAQIDALYRSTSWKVTAPLRALRGGASSGAPSGAPGA